MRAQELLHLHGLLYELRLYLERRGHRSPASFARYDANAVYPNHVHRGKEAHERAISLLLEGFASGADTRTPERLPTR